MVMKPSKRSSTVIVKHERLGETLDFKIKCRAAGKEGNLRAMLSTLQYVISETDVVRSGYGDAVVNESISVHLELQGTNSAEAEQEKIKKIEELRKQIERLEKIMNAPGYEEKVLPNVRVKNQEKLDSLKERLLLEETV